MRSPTKQTSDRRAESGVQRTAASVASPPPARVKAGPKGPGVEKEGVVTSMVDALEDILKWERASERALRIARITGAPTAADPDKPGSADLDVRSN